MKPPMSCKTHVLCDTGSFIRIWRPKWSEVAQLCPTLCDPMDCSLTGSFMHGIFQARMLEWVAFSFSRRSSWPRDWTRVSLIVGRRFTVWATREDCHQFSLVQSLSRVQFFVTPWTVAKQALLSMGFSRREYWSMLPFPSPGDLPNPGIEPGSPSLQADVLPSEPQGSPIFQNVVSIVSCLFIQFMRFSQQVYWGGLPFPPPVDHVLPEFSTMTCLGWPYIAWLIAS